MFWIYTTYVLWPAKMEKQNIMNNIHNLLKQLSLSAEELNK